MSIIKDLIPLNLLAEKDKFFALNCNYNPQFTYNREFTTKQLTTFGLPKKEICQQIENRFEKFDLENTDAEQENNLSKEEIINYLNQVFAELEIPALEIRFSVKQAARTLINTKKSYISFRLPVNITTKILQKISRHEIQTHYLRYLNEQNQNWANKKRSYKKWIRTEEGLALYNSLVGLSEAAQKKVINFYRYQYYLVDQGLSLSFQELYAAAITQIEDPNYTFQMILRIKRGLTDTSQPGAFTKSIVYFEGYLALLEWLKDPTHHYHDLYWGKISLEEVETLKPQVQLNHLKYPLFLDKSK